MNMKINIPGNTPSKKSNQVIIHGRALVLPSQAYRSWEKSNLPMLRAMPKLPLESYPILLIMKFWRKSRHDFDYINLAQSVQDILVKAGILQDDCARFVEPRFSGFVYDKDNPHCEIEIVSIADISGGGYAKTT